MNWDIQYVHDVSVISNCELTTIRWSVSSKSPCRWRSRSTTHNALESAFPGSRSAKPRASWYAKRNPNQIANCRRRSAHPLGR